jgi:D-alanyl-D-alanine carboxypeptidase
VSTTDNTSFLDRIAGLHRQLGIPADYASRHKLQPCQECLQTVSIGRDIFDREQRMTPRAAEAWSQMRGTAAASGIELQVVSAYRSIEYQASIIRRKLDSGQPVQEILQVSAAPGFSEHHTGRALDLTTPGYEPLEETFEESPAFEWLSGHANGFGFRMSFPRANPHAFSYEPWHWCWTPENG